MKRILAFALCALLLLSACGDVSDSSSPAVESSDSASAPISLESDTVCTEVTEVGPYSLDINAQYVRTDSATDKVEFPSAVVIKSRKQLDDYYLEYKDIFPLERVDKVYSDTTIGFLDACDKYDEEYFNRNYLVFVRLREGSGSISHTVTKLTYGGFRPVEVNGEDDLENIDLDINIHRHVPMAQTCDMAEYHVIIEISSEFIIESEENININLYSSVPEKVLDAQINFASELLKEAYRQNGDKNLLISPLSVQLALTMSANGAKGETYSEMQNLLCNELLLKDMNKYFAEYLDKLSKEDETLKIANSIWLRDVQSLTVKDSFIKINENTYNASVFRRAFDQSTVDEINGWVDEKTDGMIDQIIEEIGEDAVAYIINALCFEAEWSTPYSKNDIQNGEFKSLSGEVRRVEMMCSEEGRYIETDNAKGFVKSYKGSKYAFYAVMPNENIAIGDYVESLDAEGLKTLITDTKTSYGIAKLPKFKSEFLAKLNDTLQTLGMPTAFNENMADFTNMAESENGNIYIGSVLHKTFIQVDELGTKAGAVTSVEFDAEGAVECGWSLCFDRPFVYMIVDTESCIPVFIGVLNDITE